MLVMLSISTNDMNRYVSMYPKVWFIDCTSGETEYTNCNIWNCTYIFVYTMSYIVVSNSTIQICPLTLSRHKASKETIFVWFLTCDSPVVLVVHAFQRCYKVSHPGFHHLYLLLYVWNSCRCRVRTSLVVKLLLAGNLRFQSISQPASTGS